MTVAETFIIVINVKKACSLQIRFIKILCCCIKPISGNLVIYNVKTSFTCCYCSSGSNPEQKSHEVEYVGDDVAKSKKRPVTCFPVISCQLCNGTRWLAYHL
jgi:hypothetical protein